MTELMESPTAAWRSGPGPCPDRADRPHRGVPLLARPVHRQHRLPQHLGELPRREPELAVLGAERLHHRLRRRPGAGRPLGRPGRSQAGLPARAGHLHHGVRALRRLPVPRAPRRGARPAGDRRRAHAADLPRAAAARLRTRAQGRGHRPVVGRRWRGRRPRTARSAACWSRPAGAGSSWSTCPSPWWRSCSASARSTRSATPTPRSPTCRRRAPHGRGGQPGGRHRRGLRLGLDERADPRCLRAGRRGGSGARDAFLPTPEPHH